MATLPPTQAIYTITPPSSSQGERGMWEYAVPLDHNENKNNHPNGIKQQPYPQDFSASSNPPSRQPLSSQTNGSYNQSRSVENENINFSRMNNSRQNPGGFAEADNPIELYKTPSNNAANNTPNNAPKSAPYGIGPKSGRKGSVPNGARSPEDDESNWIHRDKLAQIESRELEEAGFRVGRRISERPEGSIREKRQRLASPAQIEDEVEDAAMYDFRQTDNTDVSPPKSFIPKPATGRQGGSRIPVPRSASSAQSERDFSAPGTRSRAGSFGWTGGAIDQSPKSQPGSQDSDAYAQQYNNSPPDTPPRRNDSSTAIDMDRLSPKKTRNPAKTSPAGGKKTSTLATRQASTSSKSRNATPAKTTPEPKRPGTSSGLGGVPRPSTSHRPEGEAPWIATMYKPDPRLPPDQQMLPTHAKRLAQEQWEKEGKTGTAYDRDFRLLNTEEFPDKPPSPIAVNNEPKSPTREPDNVRTTILTSKWPATPPLGSPRSISSQRPSTSGTDRVNGGYKTIPTITQPQSPPLQSPVHPVQTVRMPEPLEKDTRKRKNEKEREKEGGCCAGCVVM